MPPDRPHSPCSRPEWVRSEANCDQGVLSYSRHPLRHGAWQYACPTTRSVHKLCDEALVRGSARRAAFPVTASRPSAWRALLDTNPRSLEILLLIAVATETLIAIYWRARTKPLAT